MLSPAFEVLLPVGQQTDDEVINGGLGIEMTGASYGGFLRDTVREASTPILSTQCTALPHLAERAPVTFAAGEK